MKKRTIKAWGVFNTELNEVCSVINSDTWEIEGKAIYSTRREALMYASQFKPNTRRGLHIKVIPCTIIY